MKVAGIVVGLAVAVAGAGCTGETAGGALDLCFDVEESGRPYEEPRMDEDEGYVFLGAVRTDEAPSRIRGSAPCERTSLHVENFVDRDGARFRLGLTVLDHDGLDVTPAFDLADDEPVDVVITTTPEWGRRLPRASVRTAEGLLWAAQAGGPLTQVPEAPAVHLGSVTGWPVDAGCGALRNLTLRFGDDGDPIEPDAVGEVALGDVTVHARNVSALRIDNADHCEMEAGSGPFVSWGSRAEPAPGARTLAGRRQRVDLRSRNFHHQGTKVTKAPRGISGVRGRRGAPGWDGRRS